MNRRFLLIAALLSTLAGCASGPAKPLLVESANQTLPAPLPDRAQIVFLEPINTIQGAFPVGLYEMNGEQRGELLALTAGRNKVALNFTPGRHLLMANTSGMVAHFLEADVEAGKRYYVLLRFIYGQGLQLRPLRTGGGSDYTVKHKDFPSWVAETRFVEKTPEGEAHFQERIKEQVGKSQAEAWQAWLKKTPEQRAELTLTPQDAVER